MKAYKREQEAVQEAERQREQAERDWLKRYYLDLGMDPETATAAAAGDPVAQNAAIPLIAQREADQRAAQHKALTALLAQQAAAAPAGGGGGAAAPSGKATRGAAARSSRRGSGSGAGVAAWEEADTAGSARGDDGTVACQGCNTGSSALVCRAGCSHAERPAGGVACVGKAPSLKGPLHCTVQSLACATAATASPAPPAPAPQAPQASATACCCRCAPTPSPGSRQR